MVRSAFTIIELIFAIVIIGIAVISLPTMNQSTMDGIEGNIVQEAIFAASTELNQVVTAHWDDNSLQDGANSMARVIDIFAGAGRCDTNTSSPRFRQMAGHINQPLHRRCLDSNTTAPADSNLTIVVGLDETEHGAQNLFDTTTTDVTGYKQRYNAEINVTRPADFNGSNNNIKKIEVQITDTAGNLITKLVTYSANIGEIDYYKRSY